MRSPSCSIDSKDPIKNHSIITNLINLLQIADAGSSGSLLEPQKNLERQDDFDALLNRISQLFTWGRSIFLLFRLSAPGHALFKRGRGHVHRRRGHPQRHRPNRTPYLPHENPGSQTHNHGWTFVWNAPIDVVRFRVTNLDDVGCRNPRCNFKVISKENCNFPYFSKVGLFGFYQKPRRTSKKGLKDFDHLDSSSLDTTRVTILKLQTAYIHKMFA